MGQSDHNKKQVKSDLQELNQQINQASNEDYHPIFATYELIFLRNRITQQLKSMFVQSHFQSNENDQWEILEF